MIERDREELNILFQLTHDDYLRTLEECERRQHEMGRLGTSAHQIFTLKETRYGLTALNGGC